MPKTLHARLGHLRPIVFVDTLGEIAYHILSIEALVLF